MKFIKFVFVLLIFVLLPPPIFAVNLPSYSGRVNDFAKVFSSKFISSLEQKIFEVESQTTNQIAVVTIKNLQGITIENYAEQLFQKWGIGQKNKDNGILLLVSIEDRKVRIEVGYGLEPIITDGRAGEILRNYILPEFKKGDYEAGVLAGVNTISHYLNNQVINPPVIKNAFFSSDESELGIFLIIFLLCGFHYFIFFAFNESKACFAGGILGFFIGFYSSAIYFSSFSIAFIYAIIIGLYGLLLDLIISKYYRRLKKKGKSTKYWDKISHVGSGGGSSSGGGFGGGSSGGGGASGSW